MKIRAKLILLIVAIVVFFVASAASYFVLLAPVNRMESEKAYFVTLVDAIKEQQIAINRLPWAPISDAHDDFTAANKDVESAFEGLGRIKVLPTLSAQIKRAVETVKNLKAMNAMRLSSLQDDYKTIMADATSLFGSTDSISPLQVYTSKFGGAKVQLDENARFQLDVLINDVGTMHSNLSMATDTISEQYSIIDHEISSARARALRTAGLIVFVIIALTVLGALVFANALASSVIGIERNIASLKEGELSDRSRIASRDEIGMLAGNLNLFLDGLSTSILHIKETSAANIEAKNKLVEAAGEAMSSATQIESSTSSIGRQLETLDGRIDESSGSIRKIAAGITDLNTQIEGQSAMVEEATASVTEMLASLENMGKVTEKN
ncbi:MAG TPA: methyl-accepting chemotaxis protein, partial [Rectinemataceae bacterium]|nr:methyl-accepting chemotaxis protein [Rectinemataceae bacterium]